MVLPTTSPSTPPTVPASGQPTAPAKRIPDKIEGPDGVIVLVVKDDEFDELYPPVMDVAITGFLDHEGCIHYEINNRGWYYPQGWKKWMTLFQMKKFYHDIPDQICEHSLARDPDELIGGGTSYFRRDASINNLSFLGLRPRWEIPDIDSDFRREAIFHFQESFNRLCRWLGAARTTTTTSIIPDERMQAIGWRPVPLTFQEYLKKLKEGFPGSLAGKLRHYEILFD